MKDQNEKIRKEVIRALGKVGDERGLPELIKALKDSETCEVANRALNKTSIKSMNMQLAEQIVSAVRELVNSQSFLIEKRKNSVKYVEIINLLEKIMREVDEALRKEAA